jgi:uncharacterized protein DUF3224
MNTQANATFEIKGWDEKPYQEFDGTKFTRARVTKTYRGDIDGEATSESLMFYDADGSATFTGLERVVAAIGGRRGSFVLEARGTYRDGKATCDCSVVPGSGAGDLIGLRGEGRYVATHADYPNVAFSMDYGFEV